MPSHSGSDPAHEGQHSQRHERPGQCRGPSPLLPVHRCPPSREKASPVPRPVTNRGEVLAARGPSARGRRGPVTCRHHERAGGFSHVGVRSRTRRPIDSSQTSVVRPSSSCMRARPPWIGPVPADSILPIDWVARSTAANVSRGLRVTRGGPARGRHRTVRNGVPRTRRHHAGRRWHWGCSCFPLELDDAASAAGTAVAVKRSPRWRAIGAARW
jgi:hypothetical protein